MTDEQIKQLALEAYPVKHMEAPGFTCVDENEMKRAVYAEGLKAATATSIKDQLRAARDRCEAVITKAVKQYKEETGLDIRGLEAVIDEHGEILRVACKVNNII